MNDTDRKYLGLLKKQLSIDLNCNESDFDKSENVIALSGLNEGRRMYGEEKAFFQMATFGGNAVISADEAIHPFLKEFTADKKGFWLFEHHNLIIIEKELNKHGYTLYHPHHMFLHHRDVKPERDCAVKWFYGYDEIKGFYGDKRFPNAICERYEPHRPDRIAVCAYDEKGNIMGMAGCSEDAPHWQQIGIDVLEDYRSAGIGTYLVALIKNEILKRGDIPFYGTGLANYHSWNIAVNCGFKPAWVEIEAKKIGE